MHGLLITDPNCHLPAGVLSRFSIERLHQAEQFATRLREHWLYQCDALLAVASSEQAPAWPALVANQQAQFMPQRLAAQLKSSFRLRLYHSKQRYAALGLIAHTAASGLRRGWTLDAIRAQLLATEPHLQHYLALPAHSPWNQALPFYRRWHRHSARVLYFQHDQVRHLWTGTDPIQALLEHSLDGASAPLCFNLSVAGDPAWLRTQPAFKQWYRDIRESGSQCWLSAMDSRSARQCGVGAVSLAWINAPVRRERL